VRRRESISAQLQEEITSFAKFLVEFFGPAFAANPRLKHSVGRLLTAQLPPEQRRGRPPFAQVSRAIALRETLRKTRPEMALKQIWREIYARVIPQGLPALERSDAEDQLRRRVRWRLSARRRRGKSPPDLSAL
jgi:hypothetical protein